MKEKNLFSLYQSHLDLAHSYWSKLLKPGDWAIDATCGNGHDTLILSNLVDEGGVIGLDIQEEALKNTRNRLGENRPKVHLFCQSHRDFPSLSQEKPIRLIIYNLGYLPGGDKQLTTRVSSTFESVENALELLLPGGALSIACYPGHPEGFKEEGVLLSFFKTLSPQKWSICHHRWLNRTLSPSLLLIQKNS